MVVPEGLDVVVADADPVSVAMVSHMLTRLGARVHPVGDAAALMDLLADLEPDVLLLDLRLPDGDGRDVVRRLRAGGAPHDRLPVIALASQAGGDVEESCRAAGCTGVLRKPLDSAVLQRVLAEVGALAPAASALVDEGVLLERVGDPETAKLTREVFLDSAPDRSATAAALVGPAEPDRVELHRWAHSLGSAAELVGATPLSRQCRDLEAVAHDEPVEGLRARVGEILPLLAATCEVLQTGSKR